MIVECSFTDLASMLGTNIEYGELLDLLAMYGTPPEATEDDTLRIEVFPNRPDMLSVEGIARALRGVLGTETGLRLYAPGPAETVVIADPSVQAVRPCAGFAVVRNVRFTDQSVASIMQLQEKLHQTHGRKRRKVAIGIHDIDTVKPPFTYAAVPKDEIKFVPLDYETPMSAEEILSTHPKGKDYGDILKPFAAYPLLFDSEFRVMALPPIINGARTRITPNTTNLFVDVTGTDSLAVDQALTIVVTSLAERGGRIELVDTQGLYSRQTPTLSPHSMNLSLAYVNKLLGSSFDSNTVSEALRRMRYHTEPLADRLLVHVPAYRTDILHPIDLVEDVAIGVGYSNFSPTLPALPLVGKDLPLERRTVPVREIFVGLGYEEICTFTLTNPDVLFSKFCSPPRQIAILENPKTEDYTVARDLLLPSMLAVAAINTHNPYPQKLFEIDDVIKLGETDTGTANERHAAAITIGATSNFVLVKSEIEAVLKFLKIEHTLEESHYPWFLDGRQADIVVGGAPIGFFGEFSPHVLENFSLELPAIGMEFRVD